MSAPRYSLVVPVHNRASLTRQCLDALLKTETGVGHEIIIVDDASTDATPALLERYADRVRIITHSVNAGYTTSCNDGAAVAKGDRLLFLNNDMLARPGWLDALDRYADRHPEAAVIGAKLLFPNGTIQHAGIAISQDRIPRHIYAGFPAEHPAVNKSRRFQMVTGACAVVERGPFEELGGFSTDFINGYEDVDLCLRLGERGCEVHYCHESELYHLESATRGSTWYECNHQVYLERWAPRVRCDEFDYYVADGLLKIDYWDQFPLAVTMSPLLATVAQNGSDTAFDQVNLARARQSFFALKENIQLRLLAHDHGLVSDEDLFAGTRTRDEGSLVASRKSRRLGRRSTGHLISVVMPVKDAEGRLADLLPQIFDQRTTDEIEIVAVDSGSSDNTMGLLEEAGATVVTIEPASFNHGLARQLGANHARGTILVFLNSTAKPANRDWLARLVAPLRTENRIAGVCSRVAPQPEADLLASRDISRDASGSLKRTIREITDWDAYAALSPDELRSFINFHTVSAAIRPEVLREIEFRKVRAIGEDILWAKEVLEAGYQLQHEPDSVVLHLHEFSHEEILMVNVDDGIANREIVGRTLRDENVVPLITSLVLDDWRFLESECSLAPAELDHWRLEAALRRAAQIVGQWIGANPGRVPHEVQMHFSRIAYVKRRRQREATSA